MSPAARIFLISWFVLAASGSTKAPERASRMGAAAGEKARAEFDVGACVGAVSRLYAQLYLEKSGGAQ